MSFFDSPVGRCEAVKEMVLLDETQEECAREHACSPGCDCPLKGYFAERSGISDATRLPCLARAPLRRKKDASKAFVFAQETPLPQRKVA